MPPAARLSVIIPTLNEQANIADAVGHAWRLQPLEVLVCDGGSHDATAALAEQHGGRVISGARGRGGQLNAGGHAAAGDVLLFLHADTWLEPAAAGQLRAALESPGVVWGAFRQVIDEPGWKYRALERGNAFRAKRLRLPYGDQAVFVRRRVWSEAGGYPDQPLMEDVDLASRLRRVASPVLLDGPLHISARRWRRNGVVRQTLRNWFLLAMWRAGVSPGTLARWYGAGDASGGSPAAADAPAADPASVS